MIQRELSVMKRKNTTHSNYNYKEIFFSLSYHLKFSGIAPSSSYLNTAYKIYHCTIKNFMIKELKKRTEKTLHFDVSHKEAKRSHQ